MGNITMNTSRNMLADISKGINQIKEERIGNEAGEKIFLHFLFQKIITYQLIIA